MSSIGNAVNGPEAAPYLAKAGGTMAGAINMGSHQINALTDPSLAQDAATKAYVDAVAQGLNPKPSSAAASTGALTVTYANGSAGIGATLTNAGAQVAFAIDGYTASVGDVILIKNQASSLQNGLYTLTTVGSGASNWILTRSVYMDQPAEFLGGYTFVINGTVNAGRSFVETATVTAVGTDAVTFVQFSQSKQLTVTTQVITATGASTYTPTVGMAFCEVTITGGGGSGGGASRAGGQSSASGGGGGAGTCIKVYTAAQIGATAAVVIGTGGSAPAAGANPGNNGADSTFTPTGGGATLTAQKGGGGGAGTSSASINVSSGGARGIPTGGDVNLIGQDGSGGFALATGTLVVTGQGGASGLYGTGGQYFANTSDQTADAGDHYGSGGGGCGAIANNQAGGAGSQGICYIVEYNLV